MEKIEFGSALASAREIPEFARYAEELGYDYLSSGEHMMFHGPITNSLISLSVAAGATSRIKLMSSIVLLPLYNPMVLAKMTSVLDVVSNGRYHLGVGIGGEFPKEFEACGVPVKQRASRSNEALEVIKKLWTEKDVTFDGRFTKFSGVTISPHPIQKPHPPIWVAATNPTTFELAAERGLGVLCFTLGVELAQVAERINVYRAGIKNARPVGQTINNQVSMNIMGLVGDDPYEAEHIAREAVLWYVRKGFELVSSVAAASQADDSYKYLKTAAKFDPAKFTLDYYDFLKDSDLIAVGAADEAVRVARRYRDLGADQVLFFLQYGGIPHDRIMRSIELIGRHALGEIHSWKTPGAITPAQPAARPDAAAHA